MVKKTLLSLAVATALVSMTGCNVSTTDKYDGKIINEGVPYGPTSSVYPIFAPEVGQVPLAIDFLFAGTTDGTANTADTSPPVTTALNKLDGFSTVAPLYIEFSADLDPATVITGKTVILVKLANAKDHSGIDALDMDTIMAATNGVPFSPKGIAPASYEANVISMNDGRTPAIQILLKEPLEPKTKYLVVLTDGIKGTNGETIGQSTTYAHAIGSDKIVNPDLAPVRGALQGWQDLANGFLAGVVQSKEKSVFNYTFTTGGTDDVLKAMAAPGTFLAGQMPTVAHAEATIKGSVEAQVRAGAPAGTPEENIQAAITTQFEGLLTLIIGQLTPMLNAANASNPDWTPLTGMPLAQVRAILNHVDLAPYYHQALITAIADGQGSGVDAAVDKPQLRSYQAIVSPLDGKAVAVTYDAFFTAQIAAQVEKTVEEQITSIAIGEGAILQANNGDTTAANTLYGQIATGVAMQLNAANVGNSDWQVLPESAAVLSVLQSTEALQPYYLAGLRKAITDSQVSDAVAANLPGLSSKGAIYQGGLEIPSYLPDTESGVADNELGTWVASEAAAQALGLPAAPSDAKLADGSDAPKNVTYRFPFAKKLGMSVVPVMVTLPSATPSQVNPAGCAKPTNGYPVVIYQHGITVDRTAGVLVGNALASACVAMVAIDHTMHGVAPGNATGLVFNVNTSAAGAVIGQPSQMLSPFALARDAVAGTGLDQYDILTDLKERHNNVGKDAQQNVAMKFKAAGDAADVGKSGDLYINLQNFARTRDAMRQTVVDMLNLSASIKTMDIDASGDLSVDPTTGVVTNPDLDASKVYFIGHSLGGIIGTTFVAINNDPEVRKYNSNLPEIKAAILGNPGGGVVKLLENSPTIGQGAILPGLQAAGLEQGSADIEKFFGVMQAMVDSADPINFASSEGLQNTPVLMYTAVGDLVVPNNATNDDVVVATAKSYLAGTNPLAERLKLKTVNQGSVDATNPFVEGKRLDVHIAQDKGDHSTFSNAKPEDTFKEIYTQIGSFLLGAPAPINKGPLEGVVVSDKDILEQAE